jgi:hypothetical protein
LEGFRFGMIASIIDHCSAGSSNAGRLPETRLFISLVAARPCRSQFSICQAFKIATNEKEKPKKFTAKHSDLVRELFFRSKTLEPDSR